MTLTQLTQEIVSCLNLKREVLVIAALETSIDLIKIELIKLLSKNSKLDSISLRHLKGIISWKEFDLDESIYLNLMSDNFSVIFE